MICRVKKRHNEHDVPARREAELTKDEDFQDGGYFEFEDDTNDRIRISLKLAQSMPEHYEIDE